MVAEVGYGATGPRIGDRVYGLTDRHRDGAAAEYLAAEARDLAVLPDAVSQVDAAALVMPGRTARQASFWWPVSAGRTAGRSAGRRRP
ncbi:hypothetical protein AB0F15_09570 [Amycolatopsis sp. NPDC026612]|uniref:hypothetical protein n=1 Tax=Amycolatopsis sp. NPDC026612 TaxID=3155466 RepID=UPI0033CCC4E8